MRTRVFRAAIGLLLLLSTPGIVRAQVLGIAPGEKRFTVDGNPEFLVFVSYFDYNDVNTNNANSDFQALRGYGVRGIRIFPNWWNETDETDDPGGTFAGDTVIDGTGNVRAAALNHLKTFLDLTRNHGLLVDISFSADNVAEPACDDVCPKGGPYESLTLAEAAHGIKIVAQELAAYPNLMFDVQNESSILGTSDIYNPFPDGSNPHRMSDEQVGVLVQAVHEGDPARIVFASVEPRISPTSAVYRAQATSQNVIAYHDRRDIHPWWSNTNALIKEFRQLSIKPVYLQEPEKLTAANAYYLDGSDQLDAVKEAKRNGAAAWTFHSFRSNRMDDTDYFVQIARNPEEQRFFDHLNEALASVPWNLDPPCDEWGLWYDPNGSVACSDTYGQCWESGYTPCTDAPGVPEDVYCTRWECRWW